MITHNQLGKQSKSSNQIFRYVDQSESYAVLKGLVAAVRAADNAILNVAYESGVSTNTPLGRMMRLAHVYAEITPCSSVIKSTFTLLGLVTVDPVIWRKRALSAV